MAKALLFDSDGVLVDTHDMVEQAWETVAAEFSLDFEQLAAELAGVRAIDTMSKYLSEPELTSAVTRLESIEIDLASATLPLPGARELLNALRPGSWTIVTSATEPLAYARWAGACMPLPESPTTAADVSRGKPDPEPFLVGARKLGVAGSDCIVFEDSSSGAAAGLAAGCTVVAVGEAPWLDELQSPAGSAPSILRVQDLSAVSVLPSPTGTVTLSIIAS